jgi:hypothetical protein
MRLGFAFFQLKRRMAPRISSGGQSALPMAEAIGKESFLPM